MRTFLVTSQNYMNNWDFQKSTELCVCKKLCLSYKSLRANHYSNEWLFPYNMSTIYKAEVCTLLYQNKSFKTSKQQKNILLPKKERFHHVTWLQWGYSSLSNNTLCTISLLEKTCITNQRTSCIMTFPDCKGGLLF